MNRHLCGGQRNYGRTQEETFSQEETTGDTDQISLTLPRDTKETFGSTGVQTPESSNGFWKSEQKKKKDERRIFPITTGV